MADGGISSRLEETAVPPSGLEVGVQKGSSVAYLCVCVCVLQEHVSKPGLWRYCTETPTMLKLFLKQ